MREMEEIDHNLEAKRKFLKTSLEKSRDLSYALDETGPRLRRIHQMIPSLRAAIRPISGRECGLAEIIKEHMDRAVGPAAAVIRVFNAVHGLEQSLSSGDPRSDLAGYLAAANRYEEGLRFLADNCRLVIRWLEDTIELLNGRDKAAEAEAAEIGGWGDEPWWLPNLNKCVRILRELAARKERARLKGGLLNVAIGKLEEEFRRLVTESSGGGVRVPAAADSNVVVIKKLEAILHGEIGTVQG